MDEGKDDDVEIKQDATQLHYGINKCRKNRPSERERIKNID